MWKFPWRYKQSITIVSGLLLTGFALQYSLGGVNINTLAYPVNVLLGAALLLLIGLLSILGNTSFCKWLCSIPMSVCIISAICLLGLIMGLTPQGLALEGLSLDNNTSDSIFERIGFNNILRSWPFLFLYLLLLVSLGLTILNSLKTFNLKRYAFYLNHIGLWTLLFFSGFGSADTHRFVMRVNEGDTQWQALNKKGVLVDLPIAIELRDFTLEEYPPMIAIINKHTGKLASEIKPSLIHLDTLALTNNIGNWNVQIEKYLPFAIKYGDTSYHPIYMPGASPAAKLRVSSNGSEKNASGWICSGGISQLQQTLELDSTYMLGFTSPEPKRFASDITVYTKWGKTVSHTLEVNKPLRLKSWMLYQYGYNKDMGAFSNFSDIELVYDPWIIPIYIGLILLFLGSTCMLLQGRSLLIKHNKTL